MIIVEEFHDFTPFIPKIFSGWYLYGENSKPPLLLSFLVIVLMYFWHVEFFYLKAAPVIKITGSAHM